MSHPFPEDEVSVMRRRRVPIRTPHRVRCSGTSRSTIEQALTLAVLSLGASAFLWAITYFLVFWFSLVAATLSRSFNPATLVQVTDRDLMTANFPLWFAGGAGLALVVAGPSSGKGSGWPGCARHGFICSG